MHYSYEAEVTPADTVDDPLVFPVTLTSGILKGLEVFFPSGCSRTVRIQLWNRGKQIAPSNADGFYALDGDKASAGLHYDIDKEDNELFVIGWNIGGMYDHVITIHLEVQGPEENTMDELVKLMLETINRLIDLMRSVF